MPGQPRRQGCHVASELAIILQKILRVCGARCVSSTFCFACVVFFICLFDCISLFTFVRYFFVYICPQLFNCICSFIRLFVRSCVRSFVRSFVHSFIRSFVCLFVCLLAFVCLFVCLFSTDAQAYFLFVFFLFV